MNEKLITDLIQGIATQSPVLIVAIIGAIVTLSQWKDAPSAAVWSLFGFGLAILLAILGPVSQVGVSSWFMHNSGHSSDLKMAFTVMGVLWALVRAASYICLLIAIFAGRTRKA